MSYYSIFHECSQLSYLPAFSQRYEKYGAFTGGVRREELDHIVIEKRKARGAEVLGVGGEVEFSANDSGLQLDGTVTTIAEAGQNGFKVGQKENIRGCVAGQVLLEAEVSRLVAELALFEEVEIARLSLVNVSAGLQAIDCVDDQVKIVELCAVRRKEVCGDPLCRGPQHRRKLLQCNRLPLELPARSSPQNHLFDRVTRAEARDYI